MVGFIVAIIVAISGLGIWRHPADNDPNSARNRWTGQ